MRKARHLSPVRGALHAAFSQLGLSGRVAQQRALAAWEEIVGPQIARATTPLYIRDGVLFVATKSSAWAHELIYRKAAILEALADLAAQEAISDIRFVSGGYREEARDSGPGRGGDASEAPVAAPAPEEWLSIEIGEAERDRMNGILSSVGNPELRACMERVLVDDLRVRRWKEQQGWGRCKVCGLPHAGSAEVCALCRRRA